MARTGNYTPCIFDTGPMNFAIWEMSEVCPVGQRLVWWWTKHNQLPQHILLFIDTGLITAYLNNRNQCAQCVIHGSIIPEFSHYGSYRIMLICLK